MRNLHLITPEPDEQPISIEGLLSLMGPDKLDPIEQKVRVLRESFACPLIVRDHDEFLRVIYDYYAQYFIAFYTADPRKSVREIQKDFWKDLALQFFRQHVSAKTGDLRTAERNAQLGRDGGMIAVIDAITEGILQTHLKIYIERVFYERIPRSDYDTKLRLAQELLRKYGSLLFPGEELAPDYFLAMDIETVIQAFVQHIHAIRREWRY